TSGKESVMLEGIICVIENLHHVFMLSNLLVLILGVVGGIILGALPGVSPTLAVALLVPFTFYMEPASGLILLGAVYTASVAGGAISAILINVPGAPANIATLIDGYPMARSGHAEAALYTCFTSSFIGGMFGMLILITLTLPLAEFALKFRSTEIFWICILGLTVVASLGTGNMIKALISCAFGVWLSTIGSHPTTGEFRFVYHDMLIGGITIIPALIGLFAIPQVFSLVESYGLRRTVIQFQRERGILGKTILHVLRMFRVQTVGSIVGTIIGLIPGVGGAVAGIVAYDQVKKFSKHPERFGTGIPEGVAAAESANNAMVGPSLVPLLTLGIPGSPTAAVLLGGLLIHGIFPGPDLFRLHPQIVHTFIGGLVLAQAGMFIFGLAISRYSNWVVRVPDLTMSISIIVLATFGTYCVQNSFEDVLMAVGLGFLIYIGSKFGFSPMPIVVGLILGSIAENAFLKAFIIAKAGPGFLRHFFTGSINIVSILICAASIGYGIYSGRKGSKKKIQFTKSDTIVSIVILGATLLIYNSLKAQDFLTSIFPAATLIIMGGLSLLLFILTLMSLRAKKEAAPGPRTAFPFPKVLATGLLIVVYLYALNILGFYFTSLIFYAIFPIVVPLEKGMVFRQLPYKILTAVVFVATLYVLFKIVLKVQTPTGLFF
ncbi:MAG: tripartite tricarboxylate transporter permease, partial [Thermodesulfobacteriota bacterium]|nr:tripartite tricarboxylate transporter permease [Thermodesulfobacteriota bacterium]